MARILFVWELGRGFGHLGPYMDLVRRLREDQHEVVLAARDVVNADKIFGQDGIPILQSPISLHGASKRYPVQYNFAHLLHNLGFSEPEILLGLVKAWRRLYDQVRPELAIFDHSPTGLLASRGYPWKRIVSGSGFLIPPPGVPMPLARYWQKYDRERLAREETQVLTGVNRLLESLGQAPLGSLGEIYATDDMFLLGFREMDHYPQRPGGNYLGMFTPPDHGIAPPWPAGFRRRIFAYLHPYKTIGSLLGLLAQGNFATVIYAPELPHAMKKKFSRANVVFSPKPIDIRRVAAPCQFAITNGTFGTTAALLLHGRPVLCIPDNLERVMVARRVVEMGAGMAVAQRTPEKLKPALKALFTQDRFTRAAEAFRDKYRDFDLRWQTQRMMEVVDRLLRTDAPPWRSAGRDSSRQPDARPRKSGPTEEYASASRDGTLSNS